MSKNIKLIVGSIRQNRSGRKIADQLVKIAKDAGYSVEILDLKEINLPKFESAVSPMYMAVDTKDAFRRYMKDVKDGKFPTVNESY
jgi:NAD(P)H-dependent FMN reductase